MERTLAGWEWAGRTVAIVQARMTSSRLPGKVLMDLGGAPMLQRVVERAQRAHGVDAVLIATSDEPSDDPVAALGAALGVPVVRGSERDVLSRYCEAAAFSDATVVVRITADCPLLDPAVVDQVVDAFRSTPCDYASNLEPPTFPDGLDVEVVTREALERAARDATRRSEREHVTLHIRNHPERYRRQSVSRTPDLAHLRWTVDEPADLEFVRAVYAALPHPTAGTEAVLAVLADHPELSTLNAGFQRNAGLAHSLAHDGAA